MKPHAALVVILGEAGSVLGVSRPRDLEDFGLPGGSVEPGETPEAAAIREVMEETGLVVSALQKLEVTTYRERTVHTFLAGKVTGTFRTSEEGAVAWVSWDVLGRGTYGDFNRLLRATHFVTRP